MRKLAIWGDIRNLISQTADTNSRIFESLRQSADNLERLLDSQERSSWTTRRQLIGALQISQNLNSFFVSVFRWRFFCKDKRIQWFYNRLLQMVFLQSCMFFHLDTIWCFLVFQPIICTWYVRFWHAWEACISGFVLTNSCTKQGD